MYKCTWGFVLLFATSLLAEPIILRAPKHALIPRVVKDVEVTKVAKSSNWGSLKASPGDHIGSSQYDRQWNMSPLSRIVYDPSLGNTHVLWMHQVGGERHMFYNFYDGSWAFGTGIGGGTAVQNLRDGYGNLDYTTDGCAVASLHRGLTADDYVSCVCVDLLAGAGGFDCVDLPATPTGVIKILWPRVAVDGSNNMVVVASADSLDGLPNDIPMPRYYSRSADGGATWSDWAVIDTFHGLSSNVFASKTSEKISMTWRISSLENGLYNGHIVYKESNDGGATWGSLVDISLLIPLSTGRTYTPTTLRSSIGSTYGIFDTDDNIHILTDASLGAEETGGYYPFLSSVLWHYSSATNAMTPITIKPFAHKSKISETYPYGQLISRAVIGENTTTKYLYVSWIEFPTDTANAGYGMGEVYCSYSLNGGTTWAPKLNLTMSPEDCEVFLSMAPIVDDKLQLFYMYDKNNQDNIVGGALDPDTCNFHYLEAPITPGDIEVVEILDIPATIGSQYTPKVVYINNGTAAVSFQARFELSLPIAGMITASDLDTLVAPYLFYYDIINVPSLAAGATDTVEFKQWQNDDSLPSGNDICHYSAYAAFLVDTNLSDNFLIDSSTVAIEEGNATNTPAVFTLSGSYPNPVKGNNVLIQYTAPTNAKINIKVYDITGKLVTTLVDRSHNSGSYTTSWDKKDSNGKEVPGGVYFYRLDTDKQLNTITNKIVIVR